MPYLGQAQPIDEDAWRIAQPVLAALLDDRMPEPVQRESFFKAGAGAGSVSPYVAHRLLTLEAQETLADSTRRKAQETLRRHQSMHLAREPEIQRLFAAFEQAGIRALLIKGHALARTHYPAPLCRPTSDIDVLVAPDDIDDAEALARDRGYSASQPASGRLMHAATGWYRSGPGHAFSLDLHWDLNSRMYFRHRLSFDAIYADARKIEIDGFGVRVPGDIHALILACVHLAAMDPETTIELRWLLDLCLLSRSLSQGQTDRLLDLCRQSHTTAACAVYCRLAAKLDERDATGQLARRLMQAAPPGEFSAYDRTLRHRTLDLAAFLLRLPGLAQRWQLAREFLSHAVHREH